MVEFSVVAVAEPTAVAELAAVAVLVVVVAASAVSFHPSEQIQIMLHM